MDTYTVFVSGEGTIYTGFKFADAERLFAYYASESQYEDSRHHGASVLIRRDGTVIRANSQRA